MLTYSLEELAPPDDTDSPNDFMSILKTYFPTWNIIKSNKELQGNFNAKNYYVCAPYSECGISLSHPNPGLKIQKNGVGAFFDLQYEAAQDDPSLAAGNNLHWIQVVKSQAQQAGVPASPPIVSTFVDPPNPTPFYDFYYNQFLASPNRDHFIDRPYRGEPDINNIFLAELYLAEVKNPLNKPQEVTIYNGVKWGWQNTFTPQPPSGGGGGGCTGGSGGGGCDNLNDNYSMNNQNIGASFSEFASSFFNDNSAHQQETKNSILKSTIFQQHQPIGLYSHHGHAGFVLAITALLSLIAGRWKWINTRFQITAIALILPALILTQTRGAILAFILAAAYLCGRQYYKQLIAAILIALLIIGTLTATSKFDPRFSLIKQITSGRTYLWKISVRGIIQRPIMGWGMDGFGTAYPYIREPNSMPKIIRFGDFSYDYFDRNGQLKTKAIITTKAHNLILDTILSTGLLGLLSYSALLRFYINQIIVSPYGHIIAVYLAYIVFGFTWFDCAQFSHLIWWSFSYLCLLESR